MADQRFYNTFRMGSHEITQSVTAISLTCNGAMSALDTFIVTINHLVG